MNISRRMGCRRTAVRGSPTGNEYAAGDNCPFCGQDIKGLPLIAAFRAIFSDRYKALGEEIAGALGAVEKVLGDAALAELDTLAEQNKGAVEFWQRYCAFDAAPLTYLGQVPVALHALGRAARSLLERKQRTPLEVVSPDPTLTAAAKQYEAAKSQIRALNAAIRAANAVIATKKAETGAADPKAAEAELTASQSCRNPSHRRGRAVVHGAWETRRPEGGYR